MASSEHLDRLKDVEEFAKDLPTKFLECRELGHLWRPYSAGWHPDGGLDRTLRCHRCGTKRVQVLTSRGVVMKSHYKHPEGYLSKGLGGLVGEERGLIRIESITRFMEKQNAKKKTKGK